MPVKSVAWDWDNRAENSRWQEPVPEVYYLAERWRVQGRTRLLDLGCGIGRHSIYLAQHGFCGDAFDLSEKGIATLEKAAQENRLPIRTRVGDMLSLPYVPGAFDCVLAFDVIYPTNRTGLEQVISEIRRVLAPESEVYVTFNSI